MSTRRFALSAQRLALLANSLVAGVYDQAVARESAYEKLKGRAEAGADAAANGSQVGTPAAAAGAEGGFLAGLSDVFFGSKGPRGGHREGLMENFAKSAIRTIGSSVGRELARGVLGSLVGGGRRRR